MRQKNVLLVDDDKDLCLLIERELKLENYAVTVCNDGKSGLEALNRAVYQLIILDIMLPILNGLEVLEEIRRNNHIPVLMLTAKDSEVDKVSGLRLGADDYLTKPFLMSELIARTHSLIRRYTVFNENQKKKTVLQFKGLAIHPDLRKVVVNGEEIQLTAKEFDLLYFLAANQGRFSPKNKFTFRSGKMIMLLMIEILCPSLVNCVRRFVMKKSTCITFRQFTVLAIVLVWGCENDCFSYCFVFTDHFSNSLHFAD